jgi:pimeloyl-ACP methyl ester carboxylesterase
MVWAALPLVFGRKYLGAHQRWLDKIVAAIVSRNKKAFLSAHLEAMRHYPAPSTFASQIHCPCLVLSGTEDPLVTMGNAKRLAELCAGRHVLFSDTGHSIPAEAPQDFKSALLEFLQT